MIPGGCERIYAGAVSVEHTQVDGTEIRATCGYIGGNRCRRRFWDGDTEALLPWMADRRIINPGLRIGW